jgi:hypothetical protein
MAVPNSDYFLDRGTFYRQLAAGAEHDWQSEQWLDVAVLFEEMAADMRKRECLRRVARVVSVELVHESTPSVFWAHLIPPIHSGRQVRRRLAELMLFWASKLQPLQPVSRT